MSVLVVEDEPIVRLCAVAQLEDAGFTVFEAANAAEAMVVFEQHPEVAAVFSDINMPGEIDGLGLVRKLSQLSPGLRMILTSGRPRPQQRDMPAGARFLPKPYDGRALTALIQAA